MPDILDHFTEPAKLVLALAEEEARRFDHPYIGTQHLLVGLVSESDGVGGQSLRSLGLEVEKVRAAIGLVLIGSEGLGEGEHGLTPKARRLLERAVEEARWDQRDETVGTEHLLLGLVREDEGVAVGILENLGVHLEAVRDRVLAAIGRSGAAGQGEAGTPPTTAEP